VKRVKGLRGVMKQEGNEDREVKTRQASMSAGEMSWHEEIEDIEKRKTVRQDV